MGRWAKKGEGDYAQRAYTHRIFHHPHTHTHNDCCNIVLINAIRMMNYLSAI